MTQLTATLNQTTIRINHCPRVGHFSDGKVGQISNGIYSLEHHTWESLTAATADQVKRALKRLSSKFDPKVYVERETEGVFARFTESENLCLVLVDRSLEIVGSPLTFEEFTSPEKTADPGVIHVVDLRSGGEDAQLGQVSPAGGLAAFSAIRHAVEYCQRGDAMAMVTAPINKESLREADVPYLDHTAALEGLTGSESALTMFMTGTLRVFFMTRHMPFREIAGHITKENIIAYTGKCDYQMRRLGFLRPRLAVAALNPHIGEHGMFGDEEIREITPAVEQLRSKGLDVHGPIPADAVFHLAKEGAFDAVISLYHDQGHIATKTLDFYRTVSLTLGLPFLRTSVDHGTAFDIAGTSRASEVSMVEAILTAATYCPSWGDET